MSGHWRPRCPLPRASRRQLALPASWTPLCPAGSQGGTHPAPLLQPLGTPSVRSTLALDGRIVPLSSLRALGRSRHKVPSSPRPHLLASARQSVVLGTGGHVAAPGLPSGGSGPCPTSPVGGQGLLRPAKDGDTGHPQYRAPPLRSPFGVALGAVWVWGFRRALAVRMVWGLRTVHFGVLPSGRCHARTRWGCNPHAPFCGDARGARWGRGARGHCPCSSVPPRGSGPPQHAPGAWGKTSASCTSGPQGALRTAVPGCWEDGHPARGPAITSALSWLHDERQWLSVSPRKGPLSLPVPLGAEIKCPPLHGPGHPVRVGRGLPAGDTGTAWAGCHSPGRASPRQPGGWAKRPWNEVVAEAGSWDKGRVLWDVPLEDRSCVTQRL